MAKKSQGDELKRENCCLYQEIARLETEIADLRALVDKLPKTADGVPIMPRDPWGSVFAVVNGAVREWAISNIVPQWTNNGFVWGAYADGLRQGEWYTMDRIFSTREAASKYSGNAAAEAAHQKGTKEHD